MTDDGKIEISQRMLAIGAGVFAIFFLCVGFLGTQVLPFETKADAQALASQEKAEVENRMELEAQARAQLALTQAAEGTELHDIEQWRNDQAQRYGQLLATQGAILQRLDNIDKAIEDRRR